MVKYDIIAMYKITQKECDSMRKREENRTRHLFSRFALAYMSFYLLALLITGILYHSATSVIKDYAADSAMSLLAQTRDSIDHHLRQADGLMDRLAQDYNVQAFLAVKKPLKDTDYDSLRNLFIKLPYTDMDNSILHRLFLYFPNSGVIVNSSVASSRMESMYNYYFHYDGMDLSQWRSRVLEGEGYYSMVLR